MSKIILPRDLVIVKRALTDEEEFHPIYEEILKIIDNAHEVLGNDSTYDKWY